MNIYITPQNEENLRLLSKSGSSMSGLINTLLTDFFKDISVSKEGE